MFFINIPSCAYVHSDHTAQLKEKYNRNSRLPRQRHIACFTLCTRPKTATLLDGLIPVTASSFQ